MKNITFILICLALVFQACETKETGTEEPVDRYITDGNLMNLPRATFNKGGVKFSIANLDGFYTLPKDSVPWSGRLPQSSQNGQIVYLFLQGQDVEMNAAHIRLEYISKSVPGANSVQALFDWLKSLYVNEQRNGEVLFPGKTIETADGQMVEVLQIKVPEHYRAEDSVQIAGKYMSWAYIDHGDRFVGMNLTTNERNRYLEGMPMFYDIIRSYRKE